jgi:hypothetical protein
VKVPDPIPRRLTLKVNAKILLGAFVYVVLAAIGLWILTFNLPRAGLILATAFIAGCFVLALTRFVAWSGLWGGLNLDETGFDYRYLFVRIQKRWTDCSEFSPAFLTNGPGITFRTMPVSAKNPITGEMLNYGAVPDYFDLDRRSLAKLMNQFHARAVREAIATNSSSR